MADFRIWGRVEHIGPNQFFAIASGLPDNLGERAIVLTATAPSLADANRERERLMIEMGSIVRARGDSVVDVED